MGREYVEGPFGWARYVPAPDGHPNAVSTVACWFIHAPGQGIGYSDFMLGVVDLAAREGYPPPKLRYPRAEYELMVAGLDPTMNPVPGDVETWRQLHPVNVSEQFHGITREQAAELAEVVAFACVSGRLPVETQAYVEVAGQEPAMKYIKQALDVWKLSILRTVDHLRTGGLHERVN